ncbi:MAG: diguanylate cyclase domain-containing protein, partial [Glaciecola sp.]
FLIVSWLNETEFNALLVQFNRVLKQFSHENLELRQTASYGISIIKDDSGASLENIIEYTDKLLYESKRSGRDTMTYGCIL